MLEIKQHFIIRTRPPVCQQCEQFSETASGAALQLVVRLALHTLHERLDDRVELVWQRVEVGARARYGGLHTAQ